MPKMIGFVLEFVSRALHTLLGWGGVCIYQPTCSHYSRDAFIKYGFVIGAFKTITRVLRCHPFAKGGVDPA